VLELTEFQAEFARAIHEPASALPASLGIAEADAWRFSIYRNNYYHGLIDLLAEAYPTVVQLLGREPCAALLRQYLRDYRLREVSLALVGEDFPAFLEAIRFARNAEMIRDAAKLDRAYVEALHAPTAATLAAESLQQFGDAVAQARLVMHSATRIVPSTVALVSIWQQCRQGAEPVTDDCAPAEGALVTRPAGKVVVQALSPAATQFALCLMNYETVMDSYERAVRVDDTFDLTRCFSELLLAGAFSAVSAFSAE